MARLSRFRHRLRNRSRRGKAGDPRSPEQSSADEQRRPTARIDHSPLDRADAARDERNELERLRDEARYRRERLDLYRARLYGGRAVSQGKLRELERASAGAAARLDRAETAARRGHPPS
jgi:hypothetical protein